MSASAPPRLKHSVREKARAGRRAGRSQRRADGAVEFAPAAGWRPAGGVLSGLLALLLALNQISVDGAEPLLRAGLLLGAIAFGVGAVWLVRRGLRRGPALRIGPEGVGVALGFAGWVEVPWSEVRAWRYWQPSGVLVLVTQRSPRWVGLRLCDNGVLSGRSWDERLEMWFGRFNNRPPLCVLDPFVKAPIFEVLEAFQTHAPELADFEGRIV